MLLPQLSGAQPNAVADTAQVSTWLQRGETLVYEYPDSARTWFEQALALAEKSSSPVHHARALNALGIAYYILGEYNMALPYFTQALRLSRETNDHHGIAVGLNHIGLVYQMQGEHERAIEQHQEALVHAQLINDTERQAANQFNIGLIYDDTGQYEKALTYVTTALQLSEAHGHHRMIAMSYNRLGEIQYHLNRFEEAETYYRKALTYPHYQSTWETCFSHAGIAQALGASGRLEQSVVHGREAYLLARKMKAKWEIIRAAEVLARSYAGLRNFQQAYTLERIARQVSDSVFNEAKEKELNYVQLQENEYQKLKLERENELQQAELRYKNLFIVLGAIVLLLLLAISFILYTRHQQKVRLNRELSTINQQIEQQNAQLNELNQTKNNLLSIIGHDMRSPLVNLGALLTMLQQEGLEPEMRQRFLSDLRVSIDSVSGTLDNLLQWATSQMEGFQTTPVFIDLDHILEEKLLLWKNMAETKNVTLRHRTQGLNAYADINQVRTVLRNLIGNAIKFTPTGGEVHISYRQRAGMVGIVITDTGVGIPPDKLHELFTFKPGRHTRGTGNEKGAGLGLMIAKQFVERNNGKIRVESEPGKGTTLTVWLPENP